MKKFLSVMLSVIFVLVANLTVCYAAIGGETVTPYPEGVTQELIDREAELLQNIEDNIDVIHLQIEEFKKRQAHTIQPYGVSYGGFQYLDGDILVTKSTSSFGLTGHAGIIVGTKVLEITPGYNNGVPAAISLSTWFTRYPKTIVMRYTVNRTIPVNAAWYGQTFYIDGDGKDNEYSVASSLTSLEKDYCSSLVWKCYHFGAGFDYKTFYDDARVWIVPNIILPYDFVNGSYSAYNNFTAVHSVNW